MLKLARTKLEATQLSPQAQQAEEMSEVVVMRAEAQVFTVPQHFAVATYSAER